MSYWLRGCPRCYGDLYANDDMYGKYFACLQCGHHLSDHEANDLNSSELGLEFTASQAVPNWALAELAA